MRNLIPIAFLLIFPTIAWGIIADEDTGAITPCSQYSTLQDCRTPGCEWYIPLNGGTSSETSRCKACDTHYYNDTSHCNSLTLNTPCKCTACPTPDDINLSYEWVASDTTIGLTEKSQCAFTVNCNAGQELAMTADWKYTCVTCPDNYYQPARTTITATYGNGTYIYDIPECAKCGLNAESNTDKTQCNCKPGHYWGDNENQNTNSGTNDCEPITRTVSYRATATASPTTDEQAQIYTLYIANAYVVVPNNKKDNIDITIMTIDGTITTRTWYPNLTRTGYNFDDKWTADKKLYVCNPGQCLGEKEAGSEIAVGATVALTDDDIMGNVTFTAVWKAKKFTVKYDDGTEQYEQNCTYDTTCSAYDAPTPTDPTKYFAGWECTSGCGESEPKPVYQPGNNISNVSDGENMELTAIWNKCPAGHYCTNNTVNPCPAGSTSDGGKTQITDCYINKETQFCDINGDNCFNIEDKNFKINYSVK